MTPEQQEMADNIDAALRRDEHGRVTMRATIRRHDPGPFAGLRNAFANLGASAADAARAFQRVGEQFRLVDEQDRARCAMHAGKAQWHARLAVRRCCRIHGTTCPRCRRWDYHAPAWLVRLRDRFDAWRAVG